MTLEKTETIEGTILEEMIATDQTEQELVLISDSEKESFPIEEIEPNGEVMKDKPSEQHVDFVPTVQEKEAETEIEMGKEIATSEEFTKLKKPEEIIPAIKEDDILNEIQKDVPKRLRPKMMVGVKPEKPDVFPTLDARTVPKGDQR